jgi:hypothetical protein
VEMYHEKIEQMSDDDDATFGYLIEQAISQWINEAGLALFLFMEYLFTIHV